VASCAPVRDSFGRFVVLANRRGGFANLGNRLRPARNSLDSAAVRAIKKEKKTMALNITVHSMAGEPYAQVIEAGRHTLIADRTAFHGGPDKGPGPYSYLLTALGA
jgi:hypothetical protein